MSVRHKGGVIRILLAGVPFGCHNVGDEAILECTIRIVRGICPDAAITVSTNDGVGTERRLGVKTCPLFGFHGLFDPRVAAEVMRRHDVYIWSGATGLSDYPEASLQVFRVAQESGCRTVIFGVGMNRELNPALYRLVPGKRLRALRWVRRASLGLVDAVGLEEHRIQSRARRKIARLATMADLVVVRDSESKEQLQACGVNREIIVGADAALTLEPRDAATLELSDAVLTLLRDPESRKIGVCISAQREVRQRSELLAFLNRLTQSLNARLLFIPMDPIADAHLMTGLQQEMERPDRTALLEDEREPGEIAAVAGEMDLVISSRLHLLILASISHVPIVGISRGNKIDSFVSQFGVGSCGTTESCDFEALWNETVRMLDNRATFEQTSREVRHALLERIAAGKAQLRRVLSS